MKNLLLLVVFFVSFTAKANIIRDSEIEEVLNEIKAPLMKAANIKNMKIYLLNDNSLNAFTGGGEEVYINSGLINQFPNIDVVRGVMAHEMGHILGKHIARQQENISNYSKAALSTLAIGLATAATGNIPLASAIALGGTHFADRSLLAYSRAYESSADQKAVKLLEVTHNTSKGMIEFFEFIEKQQRASYINPYDQTHPLSQERLVALKNFYQNSKFKQAQDSKELQYKFARSAAKLLAFTTNPQKLLASIKPSIPVEIANYLRAICYFRMGDMNSSIIYINKLIQLKPDDPFYHELKGQILFEFGKKEALTSYITAARLRPDDLLIKLGKAIVGISIYSKAPDQMQEFFQDLKFVSSKEPENILALYYLAIYYEQTRQPSKALLTSALIAFKTGNISRAKDLAKAAIKDLKQGTPEWYKASDIILTE